MKPTKKFSLNFIDIFSGAGGLSNGMEQAGHRCMLGIEHDKFAASTFSKNHPHARIFCGDIHQLDRAHLKDLLNGNEIHAIIGGPPCQGFSTVGTGNPNDQRNSLFMEFYRIVKILLPSFIVIENVTGIVAKKNEKTLKAIFELFEKLGYQLDVQILSAHQFGVPEKRRRTFIIGSRINDKILFPRPTHDTLVNNVHIPPITVGKAFKDLSDRNGMTHNHDLAKARLNSLLDQKRLKKIPEGKGIRYQADENKYLPNSLKLGINWNQLKEKRFRQTKYFRLDRKLPSPTIMTNRHNYHHPCEDRFLTPREAARLQSFPNDFIFEGPISSQWRQIGNAVPPLLAKAIGLSLTEMLRNANPVKNKTKSVKNKYDKVLKLRKTAFIYQADKTPEI